MHFRTAAIFLLLISACGKLETSDRGKRFDTEDLRVENALDLRFHPHRVSIMSDEGAWCGFALHKPARLGFAGPYMLDDSNGYWLNEEFLKLRIDVNGLDISKNIKIKQHSEPGLLVQEVENEQLYMQLRLFFNDAEHAIIDFSIQNLTGSRIEIDLHCQTPLQEPGSAITSFSPNRSRSKTERFNILSYEHRKLQWIIFHDKERTGETRPVVRPDLPDAYVENCARWKKRTSSIATASNKVLASKCIETLVSNYRSPRGELKYGGCFPSYAYKGFHGFWAWDSWKHAVALSKIEPEWAKEQIRAMLNHQDAQGMVADCIFADTTIEKHNWRNSKPPLAAWAVWKVYEESGDTSFLSECVRPLTEYARWWNSRDFNGNGLCEFGSRDGSLIAAKWDSGMDNAARFDSAQLNIRGDSVFLLDQESVDLNAFRYADIKFLCKIYEVLGQKPAWDMKHMAKELKVKISEAFWDEEAQYFFDRRSGTDAVRIFGPEAWIALWAGVATEKQAKGVIDAILKSSKFNTHLPFPTLAADEPGFDPEKGYWRGPVWIDQAYFALEGMYNYGYHKEAALLQEKLLSNAQGLLQPGTAIRENYNPVTGEGLNAHHFSWSAAHLLLLITKDQP